MKQNQQHPLPPDHNPTGTLVVHSVFPTVQGEGPFAGHRAVFVRLGGCNLQCPGCDTEYTQGMRLMPVTVLVPLITHHSPGGPGLVVVTGGEPFRQNVVPLVDQLLEDGYVVQFETNGVLDPGPDFPWGEVVVVCSPKTGRINPNVALRVDAYKYVLAADDVADDGLPLHALEHPLGRTYDRVARPPEDWDGSLIYLQPMDAKDPETNAANSQACVRSVLKHREYILGVQMHKVTGLP